MEYGKIRGIDKPISRLIHGTVMINSKELDKSFALLDEVLALGCTAFDTAHVYGKGDNERTIGKWVNERGVREKVVIVGKGAHPYDGRDRVTPEDIASDIRESLERFGFDRIDLYLLHRDNPAVPVGPLVEVLNEHAAAGRIGAFGGSNWSHERIAEANVYAEKHGLAPFAFSSPNFSLAEQIKPPWEGCLSLSGPGGEAARAWYRKTGMPLLTWSSIAGGFFSGRVKSSAPERAQEAMPAWNVPAYCCERNYRRLARVEELAQEQGVSVPQIALAYVMSRPLDIFALVGCESGAEFKGCMGACAIRLTESEMAWLDLRQDER